MGDGREGDGVALRDPSPSPSPQPAFAKASVGDGGGERVVAGADEAGSIDWAEVRRAYEGVDETVVSIQQRFKLSRRRLSERRIAEGWNPRPPIAPRKGLPRPRRLSNDSLAVRLNRLIVIGIRMLEKRLTEEGMNEANARTLSELCRAEESRMRALRQKTGKTRETKNHDAGYDFRDDPAWLDAELARRLDRRFGPRGVGGGVGDADAGRAAGAAGGVGASMGKG